MIQMLIAFFSLFGMGLIPIYFGSKRALSRLYRTLEQTLQTGNKAKEEKNKEDEVEETLFPTADPMSKKDALQFPLIAGSILTGLFLVVKFINKKYVNILLMFYFFGVGVFSTMEAFSTTLRRFLPESLRKKQPWKFSTKIPFVSNTQKFSLTVSNLLTGIIGVVVGLSFIFTKNWVINNLLGLIFCFNGVAVLSIQNFQVIVLLLVGLFFYDIYFVFYTPVMVGVAKAIEGPVKLMFPKNLSSASEFSMLGLGDIVVPGLLISLMIRFDFYLANKNYFQKIHRQTSEQFLVEREKEKEKENENENENEKENQNENQNQNENEKEKEKNHFYNTHFSQFYFKVSFISYFIGTLSTILVMLIFQKPQPALLYLVPSTLLGVVFAAIKKGDFSTLYDFDQKFLFPKIPEDSQENNNKDKKEK
ncbi:minor histocompatibility antigen h13 [Anaeramoeba ignava]|uniref:Minor histocompatibility antigen h13 n=1 Tax=Anaeramoeba ignava TaxID=1746090 RepID=A0A9Q0RCC7_ANAIG|nr:minor histocompatibility antigen h13 [Anaeramoeba ignava]